MPYVIYTLLILVDIFIQILKDYLKPKLEHIASLRAATEDDEQKLLCLVSSVAICYLLTSHKVQLNCEDYHDLFMSLSLWPDPERETCSAFDRLLKHFPGEHWR